MTQPAYRFVEEVNGMSSDGASGSVHQFSAGESPTAEDFNGNTNIAFAVAANLSSRMSSIDGIDSGGNYDADETIFDKVTTTFTSLLDVIEDMKGGDNEWYTEMDSAGKSLQDLYDKTLFSSGIQVIGDTQVDIIENRTGSTLTITSSNNLDINASQINIGVDSSDTLKVNAASTFNDDVEISGRFRLSPNVGVGNNAVYFSNIATGTTTIATPTNNLTNKTITHDLGVTPDGVILTLMLTEQADPLTSTEIKDISIVTRADSGLTTTEFLANISFPSAVLSGGAKEIQYQVCWLAYKADTEVV